MTCSSLAIWALFFLPQAARLPRARARALASRPAHLLSLFRASLTAPPPPAKLEPVIHARASDALIHAAYDGDVARIGALLAAGRAVDGAHAAGHTPLLVAAKRGHAAAVAALLAAGANVHAVANDCNTALMFAAADGHIAVTAALIAAGAAPAGANKGVAKGADARRIDGWTALMIAAHHGHAAVVRALLAAGADPALATADGHTARSVATGHLCEQLLAVTHA